jgi:hypothetical protein
VEIRLGMFHRYVLTDSTTQLPKDVRPHADTDVCPKPIPCSKSCRLSAVLHQNLGENGHTLQPRRSFPALDDPHPVTTSTRIPVLSP